MMLLQNTLLLFSGLFLLAVVFFALLLRQMHHKSILISNNTSFVRIVSGITAVLLLIILFAGYSTTGRLQKIEENRIREETLLSVSVLRTAIEGSIDKINAGTATLAGSPWIHPLLKSPSVENLGNAHAVLDRFRTTFDAAVAYLLDTTGLTIASSNRFDRDSFIGKNYSFRPYFRDALLGKQSGYFAVGVTSGKRGYYRSAPVNDESGRVIGVAVIKNSLEDLDSIFASVPAAFLVDRNNMIFLSSVAAYQCRPLFTLSGSARDDPDLKHQYGDFALDPVVSSRDERAGEAVFEGKQYLYSHIDLMVPGWSIIMFTSKSPVIRYHLLGFFITAALILVVLSVISLLAFNRLKVWTESSFLSEKRFQTIFENAPEAIIICAIDSGLIIAANPLAREMMKARSGPLAVTDVITKEDNGGELAVPLVPDTVEGQFQLKSTVAPCHLSVSSALIQFKGTKCLLSFLRDISRIVETQDALEASEKQYRELSDFLPEGVFEAGISGVITYANRCAFEMFGYEPGDLARGISVFDVIVPEDRQRAGKNVESMMRENIQHHVEYSALKRDGRKFPILVHSTPIVHERQVTGFRGVAIDLTERKKMEQKLQKTEKLEALGIMAGGIAHDFNNLLSVIWSGFSIVKIRSKADGELPGILAGMDNAIRRGKDLTGRLLTYSKGGAPVTAAISLEELVRETSAFVTSGSRVRCDFAVDKNLFFAKVDSTQISQVIQNLLINSMEAMPQGGVIQIILCNHADFRSDNPEVAPGNYVELCISDTGKGIPVPIQSKVYDPFFSTKENGSGLGLATAFSIVRNHGGHIYFESSAGKGTVFHVLLPASAEKKNVQSTGTVEVIHSGKGRILIMDDEPAILLVTEKLLSHLGYSIIIAKNGDETVACYEQALDQHNKIDLVILDLTIPGGMGGRETLVRLREIDRQVKAIVSSGYSNDPVMAHYADYGFSAVITKPFNIQQLSSVVKALLDESAAARNGK